MSAYILPSLTGDDEAWIHQGGQLPLVMGNLHHASQLCLKREVLHCKLGYFVIIHEEHDRFAVTQGHHGFLLQGPGMGKVELGYSHW